MFRAIAAALGSFRDALSHASDIEPERVAVRPATAKDLDAVVELNSLMANEQSARYEIPVAALLKSRNGFKQAASGKQGLLLVGTVDGRVAAYAYSFPMPKGDELAAWLDSLYVQPRFRRSDLAEWLTRETVSRLKAQGYSEVMTRVPTQDVETTDIFARAGLADRFKIMRMVVRSASDLTGRREA